MGLNSRFEKLPTNRPSNATSGTWVGVDHDNVIVAKLIFVQVGLNLTDEPCVLLRFIIEFDELDKIINARMFFQKPWASFCGAFQNYMLTLHQLPALNLVANLLPQCWIIEHLDQASLCTLWSISVNTKAQPVGGYQNRARVSVAFLQNNVSPAVVTERD